MASKIAVRTIMCVRRVQPCSLEVKLILCRSEKDRFIVTHGSGSVGRDPEDAHVVGDLPASLWTSALGRLRGGRHDINACFFY